MGDDMKPTNFKQANRDIRFEQHGRESVPEILHTFDNGLNYISCWKIPFFERLKLLATGKVWIWVTPLLSKKKGDHPSLFPFSSDPFKSDMWKVTLGEIIELLRDGE